jgi:O-antigen/teichoic acid export membrane protein
VPLFTGLGAAVNVFGNLALIPRWGMMGAAWATFAGYLVMAMALYVIVQRFYPVRYQYERLVKVIFVSVLLFVLQKWFGDAVLLRVMFIVVCYPLGLFATNFFTPGERNRLRRFLRFSPRS